MLLLIRKYDNEHRRLRPFVIDVLRRKSMTVPFKYNNNNILQITYITILL